MSSNLEIEAKSMLSKNEYEILISNLLNIKKYNQKNYYLSSNELIQNKEKYGLRIRRKNNKFELTLKVDNGEGKLEINQKISMKSFVFLKLFHQFPNGEVSEYLTKNNINISLLKIIGSMTTTRTDYLYDGALISIDKSRYNSNVDYEIECEDSSLKSAENKLKQFLSNFEIEYKKSELSKLARFLKTL